MQRASIGFLSLFVFASLGLVACGGGSDLSCGQGTTEKGGECVVDSSGGACGEGTTEMNGECVPNLESICASEAGAVKAKDGNCVIAGGACGSGTELAADTGECIASDTECGEGLALNSDGQCEPTDEVCGDGATLQDGICVPDVSCEEGNVVVNGTCVSEAEQLAQNPDTTESENNDPRNGGTANSIPVKGVGEDKQTVFTGAIGAPKDLSGDSQPEQDVDVFEFSADAGQWFEISVRSLGLPSPLAIINGPNGYQRITPLGVRQDTLRQIAIPRSGDYTITVLPTLQAVAPRTVGVAGDDSAWKYVGVLEQIAAPDGSEVQLTSSPASGDITKLTDNFYKVSEFSSGALAEISVDSLGGSISGGELQIWKDKSTPMGTFSISGGSVNAVPVPSSGSFYILVDAVIVTGLDYGYELSGSNVSNVQQVGALSSGTKTTSPVDIAADETRYFQFSVPGGTSLEIRQQNGANGTVAANMITKSGGVVLEELELDDFENPSSRFPVTHAYYYADGMRTLILKVSPTGMSTLNDFRLRLRIEQPQAIGSGGPGDTLSQSFSTAVESGTSVIHTFTVEAKAAASVEVTPESDQTFLAAVYSPEYSIIASEIGRGEAATVDAETLEPGTYALRIEAGDELPSHDVEVTLSAP